MTDPPLSQTLGNEAESSPRARWALTLAEQSDEAFVVILQEVWTNVYHEHFADELLVVNHDLPIEIRALRHTDPWRIALLLTPWMLSRLFSPLREPGIALPAGWHENERLNAPYTVIGPLIDFTVLEQPQKAHLNYHRRLGHYLLQPLVQSMQRYNSADAVFAAWGNVIRARDEHIRARKLHAPWQQEVSRREFFSRFGRGQNR